MKRFFSLAAVAILALVSLVSRAQDSAQAQLELVRALRDKGYMDLALDYLERLSRTGPKEVQLFLPLEKARIQMEMADREANLAARSGLYTKARQEFLDFVRNRPNDPLAAEAQLEAARILALEGRSMMRRGMKLPPGDLESMVQKASDRFKLAKAELAKAEASLDAVIAKDPPGLKQSLTKAKYVAGLERQRNLLDIASTYEPLNLSLAERGKLINAAIAELTKLAALDPKEPICNVAHAWKGKGYLEVDNPNEAKKTFDMTLKLTGPEAEDAKRLTRYFQFLQGLDLRKPAPPEQVQALGEEWLKLYSNHHNTPEGTLLRFELASSFLKSAKATHKPPAPPPPAGKALYEKALALFRALENPENEFTEDASARKVEVMVTITVGGPIETITEFGPAFVAAQAQAQKMGEAEGKLWALRRIKDPNEKQKKELEDMEARWPKEKNQYLTEIRKYLNHARGLANSKTPPAELAECYANLVYVYTALGEPEKGAVLGEYAAQQMPNVSKAAAAAAYALQAYAQMINDGAGVIDDKWVKSDEDRLLRLAQFMEKTWPNDTNTDAARHQVGVMMLRQRRAKEAVAVLSRVSAGYKPAASLTDARWWWAVAAQQMTNEPDLSDKEKKFYQDQVRVALEGVPEVSTNVSDDVAQMYIQAKIQLCNALFEAKRFDELDRQAAALKKKLVAFELPASMTDRLQPTIDSLATYAQFGRASALLNVNQAAKAQDLCDEVIPKFTAQLQKTKAEAAKAKKDHDGYVEKQNRGLLQNDEKEKMEDAKQDMDRLTMQQTRESHLLRAFLSVALRANIQTGNIARSQQLLATLREAATETVGAQVYVHLVAQLKDQIEELQKAGKNQELNALIKNFRAFLDALSKQKLTPEVIFFTANVYKELGMYNDAANILDKLVDPGANAKDDKAVDAYRAGKLMQIELYRLAKNYTKAGEMIAKVETAGWGGTRIMKEKAYNYQDQEIWGGAAVAWRNIMERVAPQIQQPRVKEMYFEAYHNYIKCLYKYAVTLKDPKLQPAQLEEKKQSYIERAAKLIIKVEEAEPVTMGGPGLKEEYEKLLKENPLLKKEYDKAKAAAPAAAQN